VRFRLTVKSQLLSIAPGDQKASGAAHEKEWGFSSETWYVNGELRVASSQKGKQDKRRNQEPGPSKLCYSLFLL